MNIKKVELPKAKDLGMTVSFHKRGPGGVKTHQKASEELRSEKNVTKKSRAKVTVDIFASDKLKEWHLQCGRLKSYTDRNPPWGRDGRRFLANALVEKFEKGSTPYLHEIERAQDDFLAEVPHLRNRFKDEAGKLSESMYFPTADELREKFSVGLDYGECADAYDIRLGGLSDEQRERYENQVRESENARVQGVVRHVTDMVEERLVRVVKAMNDYHVDDDGKKHGVFRDSMIGNVREIAGMLEHWNITGDPHVDAVRRKLMTEICPLDSKALRNSPDLRKKVKRNAEDILSRVGQFGRKQD